MFVTIRSYSGSELADVLAARESEIRDVIAELDGFRAYYLLRTTDGNAVSISVFDNQGGADESTRTAAAWIKENLADMSLSPPQVTSGEVVLSF
jgi:heme-degrading monooxygenase HmoA